LGDGLRRRNRQATHCGAAASRLLNSVSRSQPSGSSLRTLSCFVNRNTVEPEFYVIYDSPVHQLSEPPLSDVHSATSVGSSHNAPGRSTPSPSEAHRVPPRAAVPGREEQPGWAVAVSIGAGTVGALLCPGRGVVSLLLRNLWAQSEPARFPGVDGFVLLRGNTAFPACGLGETPEDVIQPVTRRSSGKALEGARLDSFGSRN
jgi:hypothetical protein